MKKKMIMILTIVVTVLLIIMSGVSATNSISSHKDKNGYYIISTNIKLNITGKTEISLPKSFSKDPVITKSFLKAGKAVSASVSIKNSILSITPKAKLTPNTNYTVKFTTKSKKKYIMTISSKSITYSEPSKIEWKLVHNETFDKQFKEPVQWTEDTYGPDGPYSADPTYDEDGDYFIQTGGQAFKDNLAKFRSFRKTYTYGEDGWLTCELYGRDSDKDGIPEAGGKFISENGKAKLISTQHYDGALIRSTKALPSKYRIEVTVSNINFGGEKNGSWSYDGKFNGYDNSDGVEKADPWDFWGPNAESVPAQNENGFYFLAISDCAKPAPHNNLFWHHHKKFYIDTDNNIDKWSMVWDPVSGQAVVDGSHYLAMLWLNGETFGSDKLGNGTISYYPAGWSRNLILADKYLDNQAYTFSIERDGTSYTATMSGKFYYGGVFTYKASRKFTDYPVIWHYNQTPSELTIDRNETKSFNGKSFQTWPKDSAYPDYFFIGDPHINYYEGTAEIDNLKLFLPKK